MREEKIRELKKLIQRLKSRYKQAQKRISELESDNMRLRGIIEDDNILDTASKMARGKRKKFEPCPVCNKDGESYTVKVDKIDLKHRIMIKKECTSPNCLWFETKFEKKEDE